MNDKRLGEQSGGMALGDIYFVLFRHKWKIIILAALGIIGAATFYILVPPPYQTEARLQVAFGLEQRFSANSQKDARSAAPSGAAAESIINSEMDVMSSFDVIRAVVQTIGASNILAKAGGGKDPNMAAYVISRDLLVDHPKLSAVIHVTYKHRDPVIAQQVLREVITEFAKKDFTLHHTAGALEESFNKRAEELKSLAVLAEDEWTKKRTNSGVLFPEEERRMLAEQANVIHSDLNRFETELAGEGSVLASMQALAPAKKSPTSEAATTNATVAGATGTNSPASSLASTNAALSSAAKTNSSTTNATTAVAAAPAAADVPAPPEKIADYNRIKNFLVSLDKSIEQMMQSYTMESRYVKVAKAQFDDYDKQRLQLETQYPSLTNSATATASKLSLPSSPNSPIPTGPTPFDPDAQKVKIEALKAKTNSLHAQLALVDSKMFNLANVEGEIKKLDRERGIAWANYESFNQLREQNKAEGDMIVKELTDAPVIEEPTPPARNPSKSLKITAVIAVAGIMGGLAWAFLIELYLDRSIKRPKDLESKLGLPLMLSLPYVRHNGAALALTNGAPKEPLMLTNAEGETVDVANGAEPEDGEEAEVAVWDHNHSLHPYYEALRDRLVGYFEVRNLTHKPKLVAVTGAGKGVGTSTIAVGLAASLSETGDGNVLLVDMNLEHGAAQQFMKGRPECRLDEALADETRDTGFIHKNFYVATGHSGSDKLPRILPKRFSSLLPKLKASDYDYIIFDMPPVSQTSITPRLAGFMDMVLMVVESEKTDQDVVARANAMLAESKANVTAVLNKTRRYVPNRLLQES